MDLAVLNIFRTVVREGGVTRAAAKLHRVQSNVTTRVRQLEEELGVKLFVREGRRMQVSPAGTILLDYADRLLALADEARAAVRDRTPRGVLRLGAMESTAAIRLPAPLSAFHQAYGEVSIELKTGNPQQLAEMLLAGALDAALIAEPVPDAPFEKLPVYEEELVLVAALDHPAITDAGEGAPRTLLAFEVGCPHRKRLEDWYASFGEMPDRIIEMGSYHAMLGCVVAGMGISLLPRAVLEAFPARDKLSVHDLPIGQDKSETVLIWRKGNQSPNISALVEVLERAGEKGETDGA